MQRSPSTPSLPILQLICAALLAGQLAFAAVTWFLLSQREEPGGFGGPEIGILPTLAAGLAVLVVPVAFLVRGARFGRVAELAPDARPQGYAAAVITFFAILEGASLFNIVAWLLSGEAVPAVPVVAVLVAIALASFPSRTQLDNLGR
jgi:hypothetical protein